MRNLTKKGFLNKLIIVFLVIIVFNAIVPSNVVQATHEVGGVLLKPINSFVLKFADGIVDLIHKVIFGYSTSLLEYDTTESIWKTVVIIGLGIIAAIAAMWAAAVILPGLIALVGKGLGIIALKFGVSVAALSGTTVAIGTIVKVGATAGVLAAMYISANWFGDVAVFPLYRVSPQEIFEGKIDMLNTNFFSDEKKKETTTSEADQNAQDVINNSKKRNYIDYEETMEATDGQYAQRISGFNTKINELIKKKGYTGNGVSFTVGDIVTWESAEDNKEYVAVGTKSDGAQSSDGAIDSGVSKYTVRIYELVENENSEPAASISETIKPVISKWYYALRNIALVVMISELVYVGIRIMLCSVASEKAKYKNLLKDWIVAMCLLFIMHYIMAFANNLVDEFTNLVTTMSGSEGYVAYIEDSNGKFKKALIADGVKEENIKYADDNPNVIAWNCNNIMGLVRIQAELQGEVKGVSYIGYTIAFLVLVFYTVFFLFTYLKRLIYLSFLTMIAPMVACTYPIDKMNDGKAQAFDMWFKEYIFNLLIQPFHLILYTVLITFAFEIASQNILYTLVALGFMMPAEKLLRRFFGFEKAQTPGMLGGAVGASLVMNGMNRLLHGKPPKPPKAGQEGGGKIKESDNLGEITSKEGINNATLFSGDDEDDFSVPINTQQADIQDGSGLPIDSAAEPQGANPRQINISRAVRMPEPVENGEEGDETDSEDSDEPTPSTPVTNNPPRLETEENNTQLSRVREFLQRHPRARGVLAVGKAYAGQQFKRATKASGKIVMKVPKVAAGAAVGAAAGMIGMAAGITSGDISKVTQYTGAGLAGGYALGGSLQEFASGVLTTDEQQLKDAYNRAYYGSEAEYKKAKLKERREKFIKDDQHIKEMQSYLNCSASEAKRVLEDYGDCVDVGITDTKDIAAVSKAVESGWSKEKAMTAAKTLKKAGGEAPGRMGKKAKEDWDFKAANIVKKAGATDVTRAIRQTNKTLDDFVAFKDDLTSI